MKIKNLLSLMVTVIAVFFMICAHADELSKDIFVSNAWVQAMPPSQKVSVAYMVITNNSKQDYVLVSASCDIAGSTELHQMSDMNGMMKMAQVSNIHIPAQGKAILQSGGYHMMLINLKKPVNKGDIVPITLHFQGGNNIVVNAQVKDDEDDSTSMPGMKM